MKEYVDVCALQQKLLNMIIDNNRATDIKYFSEIVEIIDSIIQKINIPRVLVGGYNSYMGILNM